ncbi:helix-turn-helix domain-containing protein [Roseobacteraceae bacterium S113]
MTEPTKIDRLSALMSHFALQVTLCGADEANLCILGDPETGRATCLAMSLDSAAPHAHDADTGVLLAAEVSWGGAQNPLLMALPKRVGHPLDTDPEMGALVDLILSEQRAARCGSASVLNRLMEVLIVRLMRRQIEAAHVAPGLLGGLADPRLSRAIVAIHDRPEHPWRLESLAEEAALSVSHFSELFRTAVGMTPLAYLRKWRLILARQDIERGARVQRVATRYCYGSTEALSRAFAQAYGASPTQLRKAAKVAETGDLVV